IGAGDFIGSRIVSALDGSDWATAIAVAGSADIAPTSLSGVSGVFNATVGRAHAVLAAARALYSAAHAASASMRIVQWSSMSVYGSVEGVVDESAAVNPDLGAYASAHIEAERIAAGHTNSVILRPGCEYGPQCPDWSRRIARLLLAHRLGDLGSAGDGFCNLVYIDDLAAAALACLRTPDIGGQAFNLAMPCPPPWNEYFIRFGVALGAVPVSRISARRLKIEEKILAPPLKAVELLARRFNIQTRFLVPAVTPSLLRACRQEIKLESAKAQSALSMTWTPLNEGLSRAAAAFRAAADRLH
ncbi:MAG TPA: NAD-dependent epimerase/dehydratase family protein, partial [Steroidobacteraceae bacterium]|nr:NAD-dependent epimerase/dehydratase family protein [Steroidobacteraceae bacterium]